MKNVRRGSLIIWTTVGFFCSIAWLSDFITFQGERTVYTAECHAGTWQVSQCTGQLVAGPLFRFRALKAHHEVLFWTAGSSEPSGKFTDCAIQDGRNWSCKSNADFARTITREMVHGSPVPDTSGVARPYHQISKVRWLLLKLN